jgi:hypothetical protein
VLKPWQVIADSPEVPDNANRLSARLESELPKEHVLHGLKVRAVATRIDRDDVLFEIEGGHILLAMVHMTWCSETDPRWPHTKFFQSWEAWVRNEMLPAHEE